jgi:hypothetical protein
MSERGKATLPTGRPSVLPSSRYGRSPGEDDAVGDYDREEVQIDIANGRHGCGGTEPEPYQVASPNDGTE